LFRAEIAGVDSRLSFLRVDELRYHMKAWHLSVQFIGVMFKRFQGSADQW
jgi:hypothetical protein